MSEHTIEKTTEVPTEEAFLNEAVDDNRRSVYERWTDVESVATGVVVATPVSGGTWKRSDFLDIKDSQWRVSDVSSGEHGPEVEFVREE